MLKTTWRLALLLLLLPGLPAVGEVVSPPPALSPVSTPAAVPESPASGQTVSCFWNSVLPELDFQPEGGDVYLIAVSGEKPDNLSFSYRLLQPYRGDVRIAVHTRLTTDNRILVDQNNLGLFSAQTGEFTLSLAVPSGWTLYLVEASDNPYADPVVLSNIVELP